MPDGRGVDKSDFRVGIRNTVGVGYTSYEHSPLTLDCCLSLGINHMHSSDTWNYARIILSVWGPKYVAIILCIYTTYYSRFKMAVWDALLIQVWQRLWNVTFYAAFQWTTFSPSDRSDQCNSVIANSAVYAAQSLWIPKMPHSLWIMKNSHYEFTLQTS